MSVEALLLSAAAGLVSAAAGSSGALAARSRARSCSCVTGTLEWDPLDGPPPELEELGPMRCQDAEDSGCALLRVGGPGRGPESTGCAELGQTLADLGRSWPNSGFHLQCKLLASVSVNVVKYLANVDQPRPT